MASSMDKSTDVTGLNQSETDTSKSEITVKYKGLGNQGATCYMNSLLQSLFMTPEFRSVIYSWEYDEKKHGKRMYSIPYQLQHLFGKLQIGDNSYESTIPLVKSFNWDISESMEQQDIQEFSAVLFDAVESSDVDKKLNIGQLYEGFVSDYIKCKVCGGGSDRQDRFINLSLPINDPFTNTYNTSLEMALENYIKPEVLSGANAYQCEKCNAKVDANKGMNFVKLPLILTIQLNRFTLNFETQHRVKINDRVTFPFVLNMNNYMKGYDNIKKKADECIKELDEELKLFGINKISKEEQKPEAKPKEESMKAEKKEESVKEEQKIEIKKEEKKMEIDPITGEYMTEPLGKEEYIGQISGVDLTEEERNNPYLWELKPKTQDAFDASKSAPYANPCRYNNNDDLDDPIFINEKTEKEELDEAIKKINQMENIEKIKKFHENKIKEYLKDGEDVYELFSVNVHTGGAFGGHYYVYIKSFEDHQWYCFNDSTVTISSEWDILDTFGDNKTAKSAYMLIYRKVGVPTPKLTVDSIPKYLREEIEIEQAELAAYEEKRKEEFRKLTLPIVYGGKTVMIQVYKDDTLKALKAKIIEEFKIDVDLNNCRLRAYVKDRNLMLDVYPQDKDNLTLQTLNISAYRFYTLEIKKAEEKFEQFGEEDMYVRLIIYNPEFKSIDEESLPAKNIQVKKAWKISDLINKIAQELKVVVSDDTLRVYKRHRGETYQDSYFESLMYEEAMEKSLKDFYIYDGTCLYIETINSEDDLKKSRWVEALNEDKAKLNILYNDPHSSSSGDYSAGYESLVVTKKTITLRELKKILAEKISAKEDEFIMKRTSKEGQELKELDKTLASLSFTRNTTVHIEFGNPGQADQFRVLLSEATMSNNENDDTEFYEFVEWGNIDIKETSTVLQVKSLISTKLQEIHQRSVPTSRIRLRERTGDKLGKVLFDMMEMRYYGIFDSKAISFQVLAVDENFGPDDVTIMIREWNPEDWSLSERKEIVVTNTWRMHDLSYKLCEYFPQYRNQIDTLEVGKLPSLWNFKRGEFLGLLVNLNNNNSGQNCTII